MTARVERRNSERISGHTTTDMLRAQDQSGHVEIPTEQRRLESLFPLDNPTNPHMSGFDVRVGTFRSQYGDRWPRENVRATPEEIAEAGFFYLGDRDRVKCWYCNGGLQNWEIDDDPWIEHAKWFPNCQLVLREKGPDFVHAISSQFPNLRRPQMAPLDIPPPPSYNIVFSNNNATIGGWSSSTSRRPPIIDPREEARKRERLVQTSMETSTLVPQARDMGFTNEEIKQAMTRQFQHRDRDFNSFEELVETLTSMHLGGQESGQSQPTVPTSNATPTTSSNSTEDQIKRLEEERKCKVCHTGKSTMVFVPCGHLASCESCARSLQNCPVCGSFVREKIKAFLA